MNKATQKIIPFNKPCVLGNELSALSECISLKKFSGDGPFTKKCQSLLEKLTQSSKALLTTSCTDALEMSAILANIQPGDEVIAPSFTFVSTVNAFILRGAHIKFVDVSPLTMNIDENLIEAAITPKTKAIVVVHYGGIACNMDIINALAKAHRITVIEDAAQALMGEYKGRRLGSISDIACLSFHETKNYNAGEGGSILLNDESLVERAEIIREKGTDRSKFYRGLVDKYTWADIGSSILPSELNDSFLFCQLEDADIINNKRRQIWATYQEGLQDLSRSETIELATVPDYAKHNGHLFYLKVKTAKVRDALIQHLKAEGIMAVFHYIPLHSSPAGIKFSKFVGVDNVTTDSSERLLRLPLFYDLTHQEQAKVLDSVDSFFRK